MTIKNHPGKQVKATIEHIEAQECYRLQIFSLSIFPEQLHSKANEEKKEPGPIKTFNIS